MIREADWRTEQRLLRGIRNEVFVQEQGVPESIERDGLDEECLHVLAFDPEMHPIATARMRRDGHIGRVAVLREWRGKGIGRLLVERLVQNAKALGLRSVDLDSQIHAADFYEHLGFQRRGAIFLEAEIRHVNMVRKL